MGRVIPDATIENLGDLYEAERGLRPADQVRRVHVPDALVASGATSLALPSRLIHQLSLKKRYEKRSRSGQELGVTSVYEAVRITIQGRDASVDVMEMSDDLPVLVGQIPLEIMDLVLDPRGQKLIGNPAHNCEQTLELY